ncbi:TetR/AcrR family transcriptional regulator [Treponema sp. SP13]|uniref:TetR/AcrR family transcriptional regulator n=1 Tax=Treponema sp. SP13 TaxID=2789742 RepID=UPI003D8F1CC4
MKANTAKSELGKTKTHTKSPSQSEQASEHTKIKSPIQSKRSTKHAKTKAPNSKERILQCAASEFLQKGWAKSSMREVAKLAGLTTGSLYFHFKNKEALFDALVKDVYDSLLANHRAMYDTFFTIPPDIEKRRAFRFESRKKTIDFVYENYRAVKLLVCGSAGTRYADFFSLMMEDTYKADVRALSSLKDCGGVLRPGIDLRLYSAIDKSFWNCLFETVRLDIPYEGALKYVALLDEFYEAGWYKILCDNCLIGK